MATQVTEQTANRRSFQEVLHLMSPAERLAAYRSGAFTNGERAMWAANYPDEVPLVNDELPWIALTMADHDVGSD
jgi:hypothetical protein